MYRFKITMNDAFAVDVLECDDDLGSIEDGTLVVESAQLLDVVKQLSSLTILHHKICVPFCYKIDLNPKLVSFKQQARRCT